MDQWQAKHWLSHWRLQDRELLHRSRPGRCRPASFHGEIPGFPLLFLLQRKLLKSSGMCSDNSILPQIFGLNAAFAKEESTVHSALSHLPVQCHVCEIRASVSLNRHSEFVIVNESPGRRDKRNDGSRFDLSQEMSKSSTLERDEKTPSENVRY
jgi:hypothetical protein